jgi:hypothetical protein
VFSCLAHPKAGSLEATQGNPVVRVRIIGELGTSGNDFASRRHLHFMDGPNLLEPALLPVLLTAEGQTLAPSRIRSWQ